MKKNTRSQKNATVPEHGLLNPSPRSPLSESTHMPHIDHSYPRPRPSLLAASPRGHAWWARHDVNTYLSPRWASYASWIHCVILCSSMARAAAKHGGLRGSVNLRVERHGTSDVDRVSWPHRSLPLVPWAARRRVPIAERGRHEMRGSPQQTKRGAAPSRQGQCTVARPRRRFHSASGRASGRDGARLGRARARSESRRH